MTLDYIKVQTRSMAWVNISQRTKRMSVTPCYLSTLQNRELITYKYVENTFLLLIMVIMMLIRLYSIKINFGLLDYNKFKFYFCG